MSKRLRWLLLGMLLGTAVAAVAVRCALDGPDPPVPPTTEPPEWTDLSPATLELLRWLAENREHLPFDPSRCEVYQDVRGNVWIRIPAADPDAAGAMGVARDRR